MCDYKSSLDEVEAGDKVIVSTRHGYRMCAVTGTTRTQIKIGETRFAKDGGNEIGGNKWSSQTAYAPLAELFYSPGKTHLDSYNEWMERERIEKAKAPYVLYLSNLSPTGLRRLDMDALEQAAKLLGYGQE